MEPYSEYWKYRQLNNEYFALIEKVKYNRHEARRCEAERKSLDNSVWEAQEALKAAYELDDARQRERAAAKAQDIQAKAEETIRRYDARYDAARAELESCKKSLVNLLDRLKHDKPASDKINSALLSKLQKELAIKEKTLRDTRDFIDKLGKIQENLMGKGIIDEESLAMRREYDTTLTSIASLTDIIAYFEEQEKKLSAPTVPGEAKREGDAEPPPRDKTEEELLADRKKAEELLNEEIRPRRIERAKNREKLAQIISSEARKIDMDPRDIEGIHTTDEMQRKRDELKAATPAMEEELALYRKNIRQLTGGGAGSLIRNALDFLSGVARAKNKSADGQETSPDEQAAQLKEPDDTEDERFTYRYKVLQREMNRRYNALMGLKDNLTEHAYLEEDEENP